MSVVTRIMAFVLGIGLVMLRIGVSPAVAGSADWRGLGGTDFWSEGMNWQGSIPPHPLDELRFGPMRSGTHVSNFNDFIAGAQFNGITFQVSAPSFNLQGNRIVLGGVVANNSSVTQQISLPLTLTPAGHDFDTVAGDLILSGALNTESLLGDDVALVKNGNKTLILSDASGTTSTLDGLFVTQGSVLMFNSLNVSGMTNVSPDATLTVQPTGSLHTGNWDNLGANIVHGTAEITGNLTVGGVGAVDSFFDVYGSATVDGDTTVKPSALLTVHPAGFLRTGNWINLSANIVHGTAEITGNLTVGGPGVVDSFFDVYGSATVGGDTTVNPSTSLTVHPAGFLRTGNWNNLGANIVHGTAEITGNLTVGGPGVADSFFDVYGEMSVGGDTTVNPNARLSVQTGGKFTATGNVANSGTLEIVGTGSIANIDTITGSGSTFVGSGATLTVMSITQSTLVIGGTSVAVPEPSSLILLALAGLIALSVAWRRT